MTCKHLYIKGRGYCGRRSCTYCGEVEPQAKECPRCKAVELFPVNRYVNQRMGRPILWTEYECRNCHHFEQMSEARDMIELQNQYWWWQQNLDEEWNNANP
jgi:hypothetical protein